MLDDVRARAEAAVTEEAEGGLAAGKAVFAAQTSTIQEMLHSGLDGQADVGRRLLQVQVEAIKGTLAELDVEAGKELLLGQTAALQAMVTGGGEQAVAAQAMLQQQVSELVGGLIGGLEEQLAAGKALLLGKADMLAAEMDARIAEGGVAGKVLAKAKGVLEDMVGRLEELEPAEVYAKLQELTGGGLDGATDVLLAEAEAVVAEGGLSEEQLGAVVGAGLNETQVAALESAVRSNTSGRRLTVYASAKIMTKVASICGVATTSGLGRGSENGGRRRCSSAADVERAVSGAPQSRRWLN